MALALRVWLYTVCAFASVLGTVILSLSQLLIAHAIAFHAGWSEPPGWLVVSFVVNAAAITNCRVWGRWWAEREREIV